MKHPLRVLRESRCLTQRELAATSGVSPRTIVSIETGFYSPRMQTRRRLLLALGIDFGEHREVFGALPGDET
jgi:DNA-binding XRE family transcriptional regulator